MYGRLTDYLSMMRMRILRDPNGLDDVFDPIEKKAHGLVVYEVYMTVVVNQSSFDDGVITIWWKSQELDVHQRYVDTLIHDLD